MGELGTLAPGGGEVGGNRALNRRRQPLDNPADTTGAFGMALELLATAEAGPLDELQGQPTASRQRSGAQNSGPWILPGHRSGWIRRARRPGWQHLTTAARNQF